MMFLQKFLWEEEGATAVEYAVVLAGVIVVCIAAVASLGLVTGELWSQNADKLPG